MAEFSSNGKGNLGVTLGAIGTGLAALGNGNGGILSGLFGNRYGHSEDEPVTRYESEKDMRIAKLEQEIALGKAEKAVDAKGLEIYTYFDTWRREFEQNYNNNYTQQAVYNATNTANINCMQGEIAQLQSMTKLYIPATNVSPQPMNLYNSWTAPTTTTTTS